MIDPRIETLREMTKVQGYDGNWNYDPYMMGMYNGMEYALSIFEMREPVFKSTPAVWMRDVPVGEPTRDLSCDSSEYRNE